MTLRVLLGSAVVSTMAFTAACAGGGDPLTSWDTVKVSVNANDDIELIPSLRVESRFIELIDSHGTVDNCPQLAGDARIQIGGADVDDKSVLRGGLVATSTGEIDFRPDFMKPQACGEVSAMQTRALDKSLPGDDVVITQGDETRHLSVPGIGASAHLAPTFDPATPIHAGDTLRFALAVPTLTEVASGATFDSTQDDSVQVSADVHLDDDGDGAHLVSLIVPSGATGHVSLLVSLDYTLPCGDGFASCTTFGATSWSRNVNIE